MQNVLSILTITLLAAPAAHAAPILACHGTNVGANAALESYSVRIDAGDQGPGSVKVTIIGDDMFAPIRDGEAGTLTQNNRSGAIQITFRAGIINVAPGNSGITGISKNLSGHLTLKGRAPIGLRCPVK